MLVVTSGIEVLLAQGYVAQYIDAMGKKLDKLDELKDPIYVFVKMHISPHAQDKVAAFGTQRGAQPLGF